MKKLLITLILLLYFPTLAAQELSFASGTWYNALRGGEGFVVQILPDNRAFVAWFTYPPEGEEGEQAWMIGAGTTSGNEISITTMERPIGAVFGPDFDPSSVIRLPWGTLNIVFHNCNSATVSWSGMEGFGSGSMDLTRLSTLDGVGCDARGAANPNRVISGRSGTFFDPSHDGEGWMMEMLEDGRIVVYWFTYDGFGRQAWMIGVGEIRGRTLWIEDMQIASGTHFGDAFVPQDVVLTHWGSYGFFYETCDMTSVRYASVFEEYGSGALNGVRLSILEDTNCGAPDPVAPLNGGQWQLNPQGEMAVPSSESVSVTVNDMVYLYGGFGAPQSLRRYDPTNGSFTDLASPSAGRHHPMMATDGRHLYAAGGYSTGVNIDGAESNFWRYDIEKDVWEDLPDLPQRRAAGAAVYAHSRIYIIGGEGIGNGILVWDIAKSEWSSFTGNPVAFPDHTNAVVFENEIWQIAGRGNRGVSDESFIWNPVSQEWRDGPSLKFARSGYAARVVQGQIMVSGGEIINGVNFNVVNTTEVYAPGNDEWAQAASMTLGVHGTSGASVGGNLVLLGGSSVGGSTNPEGAIQIYIPMVIP